MFSARSLPVAPLVHPDPSKREELKNQKASEKERNAKVLQQLALDTQQVAPRKSVMAAITTHREDDKTIRGRIRILFENPYSSTPAFILSYILTTSIMFSVFVLCMSTVEDEYYTISGVSWSKLDLVFNSLFTFELFFRVTCVIEFKHTVWGTISSLDAFFWIDVLSVVPFWLVQVGKSGLINLLRAFSMMRMLKLLRQYNHLSVPLAHAVVASRKALAVPFFFLFVLVLIFGSFIYYLELEGENEGGVNSFESIPHAIWFMMVTMTTVGYGDVVPGTTLGKLVCVLSMIMGVLFLSMPLAIVGNNFCQVWDERYKLIMVFKLQKAFKDNGLEVDSLRDAFEEFDLDHNGSISIFEFRIILQKLQVKLTNREFMSLWNSIDTDLSGELDWEEFVHIIAENSISENAVQKMDHDMYMHAMENRLGHREPAPAAEEVGHKLEMEEPFGDVFAEMTETADGSIGKPSSRELKGMLKANSKHRSFVINPQVLDSQFLDHSKVLQRLVLLEQQMTIYMGETADLKMKLEMVIKNLSQSPASEQHE